MQRRHMIAGMAGALATGTGLLAAPALLHAQTLPKITIGMSGWTGFAPLTLAEEAGLFKANGLEVETRFIAQRERNLALASGALNCVVTTVDTMVMWGSTLPLVQVLVLDKSKGGDGVAVRPGIRSFADLKGQTMAVDGPGSSPYFLLTYMLRENNLSIREMTLASLAPQPAAQAFAAGRFDGCTTYEPYLSQLRTMPADQAHILATTLDYPCVVDTLALAPAFVAKNPEAIRVLTKSWFDALAMIKADPAKSFALMGKRVNQSAQAFEESARFIEWQDQAMNHAFMDGPMRDFMLKVEAVQKEIGVMRGSVEIGAMINPSFLG